MNDRFKIVLNKLYKFLLILFPATLPLSRRASSIILVLLILIWIPITSLPRLRSLLNNKGFIILIAFFLFSITNLLYSSNKDLFQLEKKLSLIALPFVVGILAITPLQRRKIFYSFIVGCFIAVIYSLLFAIKSNYELNQFKSIDYNLFGTEMTINAIDISHVYFGMYLSFLIAYLLHEIFISQTIKRFKVVGLVFIGAFSVFLFMMGAKMAIISLFLLILIVGLRLAIRKRQLLAATLIIGIPIILFFFTINFSDYARGRFIELTRQENYFVGDNAWNSIGVRLSIYKCSIEIFNQTPFFGTGIGDIQNDLNQCYQKYEFLSLQDMNPHNQYVQWILSGGLIGFLLLFISLSYFMRYSIVTKDWVYFSLLFILTLCCLTESILERQQGVMFYSFFNALLFFHKSDRISETRYSNTLK